MRRVFKQARLALFASPSLAYVLSHMEDVPDPQTESPKSPLSLPTAVATPLLALAVLPGPTAAAAQSDREPRLLSAAEARAAFQDANILVVHAAATARRLKSPPPPRSKRIHDLLELFAFVRPGQFAAPTATGIAMALGLSPPTDAAASAVALRTAMQTLLTELRQPAYPGRAQAYAVARTLQRGGWAFGDPVVAALEAAGPLSSRDPGSGLDVWARLGAWEETAPFGEPGSRPATAEAARMRLREVLERKGLDEARPTQAQYAEEAAFIFSARDREGEPRVMLAEAGTGTGKTLAYLAPASVFAELNGPSVWISTYTRALQRQIERESAALFPDPAERARRAVVRKGRENYLCLLNFQDLVQAAQQGSGDLVSAALTARWISVTRDGDMTGGDYPAWLSGLFASGFGAATPGVLVDRRGECVHAGCPHYRVCFIEKAVRASRSADLVIANHALVLSQAAFDGARRSRGGRADGESTLLRRIIFDEGHHLFDAADQAFSAAISGAEAFELRRWIRGPEGRRRGRGLEMRLADLLGGQEAARQALARVIGAASQLPGEGWSMRVVGGGAQGDLTPNPPVGPIEVFLAAALAQLRARGAEGEGESLGLECSARPATPDLLAAAPAALEVLLNIERPLVVLARALEDLLDAEADSLSGAEKARIEGALRGLDRRARFQLPAWRSVLQAVLADEGDPQFVDWFEAVASQGRLVDVALRRHYVDPTEPLAAAVLRPAHGVLVTSATLSDPGHAHPFALAELRSGAARLEETPKILKLASPFDYRANALALVVTDVTKTDARQVAAAMRELFLAAGGGALGLFTAVRRLRTVHDLIAGPLAQKGLSLYAQHVDALEVGALVDIFRAEVDSCLLGTDAVRDGVDVPGRALRLICFDRAPWPRPDVLHKARRESFGGRAYDDSLARGRIAQAFGRLIRRDDDRGVFVMLDAATPTRLFSGLPEGVELRRLDLVSALETVRGFLG